VAPMTQLNARAPAAEAHASIHTHRCQSCNKLRVCLQAEPCPNRVIEYEKRWFCAKCREEAQSGHS